MNEILPKILLIDLTTGFHAFEIPKEGNPVDRDGTEFLRFINENPFTGELGGWDVDDWITFGEPAQQMQRCELKTKSGRVFEVGIHGSVKMLTTEELSALTRLLGA